MGKLPHDACPYVRPFPEDFRECPTFMRGDQSCAHLTVGTHWDELRHRYARCALGDSSARLAHLKTQIVHSESYVNLHADFNDITLVLPPIMPPR